MYRVEPAAALLAVMTLKHESQMTGITASVNGFNVAFQGSSMVLLYFGIAMIL